MQRKTSIELYTINKVKEKRKALKISQRQLSTDLLAMYFNCELWDFFPDKPFEEENTKYLPKK